MQALQNKARKTPGRFPGCLLRSGPGRGREMGPFSSEFVQNSLSWSEVPPKIDARSRGLGDGGPPRGGVTSVPRLRASRAPTGVRLKGPLVSLKKGGLPPRGGCLRSPTHVGGPLH